MRENCTSQVLNKLVIGLSKTGFEINVLTTFLKFLEAFMIYIEDPTAY